MLIEGVCEIWGLLNAGYCSSLYFDWYAKSEE